MFKTSSVNLIFVTIERNSKRNDIRKEQLL